MAIIEKTKEEIKTLYPTENFSGGEVIEAISAWTDLFAKLEREHPQNAKFNIINIRIPDGF